MGTLTRKTSAASLFPSGTVRIFGIQSSILRLGLVRLEFRHVVKTLFSTTIFRGGGTRVAIFNV
jgi:hypothetical protein